jgi:hypothetical protein
MKPTLLQLYWKQPRWRRTEFPAFSALFKGAERDYQPLKIRAEKYDLELQHDLVQAGGAEYAAIATFASRQAIGAHKWVEDANGIPLFMPKENFSNYGERDKEGNRVPLVVVEGSRTAGPSSAAS